MKEAVLGVLGGTGLYSLDCVETVETLEVETPFGTPSSPVTVARLGSTKLLFIARHGEGHVLLPSEIPYRANMFALKKLGAEWCLSISAVGSLRDKYAPGDMVIPNQIVDRTKSRQSSFYGNGICVHVPFAHPFCPEMRKVIAEAASSVANSEQTRVHEGGATYVCMEGPAFSTRAESMMYRGLGAGIIGMTGLPEAKLAREAEIAYAMLALVTDYDCWKSDVAEVDIKEILSVLNRNVSFAQNVLVKLCDILPHRQPSKLASSALESAIVTKPEKISAALKQELSPLIAKYVSQN